jgi:Tfp pilus assembly protein PilV
MALATSTRPIAARREHRRRSLQSEGHSLRRGISLVEVTVAAVVLSALVLMLGQSVGWVATARKDADRRQVALLEAGNVMEQITALPFEEIDNKRGREVRLSDYAHQLLGADALVVEVQAVEGEPKSKRISVGVGYKEPKDRQGLIRLTAWVYDRGGR